MSFRFNSSLIVLLWIVVAGGFCRGQSTEAAASPGPGIPLGGGQAQDPALSGSISGAVVDQSGAVVAGARVSLTREGRSASVQVLSGEDGQFSFAGVAPGPFQITIAAVGFAAQTSSGVLTSGENYVVPRIALALAMTVTDVVVGVPRVEVAEEEMKVEEKQRVLGVLPNFYVSYNPNAVALSSKQKFKLAARTVVDPFTLVMVAGTAGVQQAQNHFREYGQGALGYGKRFGAGYADTVTGTFIGGAILPSLLKQDPRYFYKGTGSKTSRFFYAVATAVICKGDNGHWQANYSGILGSLAAGGISNLYYPSRDREGAELTFENAGIGIGSGAVSNLFQEFFIKKLTPKIPRNEPATP